jgi:hypothetical protein
VIAEKRQRLFGQKDADCEVRQTGDRHLDGVADGKRACWNDYRLDAPEGDPVTCLRSDLIVTFAHRDVRFLYHERTRTKFVGDLDAKAVSAEAGMYDVSNRHFRV